MELKAPRRIGEDDRAGRGDLEAPGFPAFVVREKSGPRQPGGGERDSGPAPLLSLPLVEGSDVAVSP